MEEFVLNVMQFDVYLPTCTDTDTGREPVHFPLCPRPTSLTVLTTPGY